MLSSQKLKAYPLIWPCSPEEQDTTPPSKRKALVHLTRKPSQDSGPTSPTKGKTPEKRGTTILQYVEKRQTHKLEKNDRTEKYTADEGAR